MSTTFKEIIVRGIPAGLDGRPQKGTSLSRRRKPPLAIESAD